MPEDIVITKPESAGQAVHPQPSASSQELKEERRQSAACPCCHPAERHKERTDKEYRDLIMRLNRIEGQIRGIRGMVEDSAYCIDILTQVSAATSALNSFSKVLLQSHIKSCVAEDIRGGSGEKLDELIRFLPKMMK